ncbi:MAG: mechanosensitive ion channel family protein [Oscillospiraceae bacterium]|nr:mechanosensitive ion channel family protein [Oscillospiraceae bacterium]
MEAIKGMLAQTIAGFALEKLLVAVLLAVVCLIVVNLLMKLFDRVTAKSKLDGTIMKIARLVVKLVLLFIGVIIVMGSLGIPVTSLVALLSVAGLAVSLAVQNFLSNVAGGLQIVASHPFKIGDYVEASGCSGTVEEIGLFHTKLCTPDNKLIQLPNSAIVGANIINYSSQPTRRVDISVTASYDSDTEKVKAVLLDVMGDHPLVLAEPAPFAHVSEYGDNAIGYTARAWCASGDYWTVYFDLMDALKPAFDKAGIEMTYPHVNVHMMEK